MTFSTTVFFPPGTHHIHFFVDGDWRVADDLPTAVNDLGSLSNYINVELPQDPLHTPPSPPSAHTPPGLHLSSSPSPIIVTSQPPVEGNDLANLARLSLGRSFWSNSTENGDLPGAADRVSYTAQWTTEIPLELSLAAQEEETYVESHAQRDDRCYPKVQDGFVPLPNIPPAPGLPRYLDKLILNQSLVQTLNGTQGRRGDRRGTRDRDSNRDRNVPPSAGAALPVTTASGTDVTRGMRSHIETDRMRPVMETSEDGESSSEAAALAVATIADDASVLPVPSHVVLHHLCTSAIKEGVLAVASTVRYRKKYITSVYYKSA
jgi:hypothetical protein